MNKPSIIALSAPVAIEAGDAKRVPTFEAVIYTGGALEIGGWDLPVVIDLAGLVAGNVLVANLDHNPTKRVGNFKVENDGKRLLARGFASAATPARDEVVESAKAGYTWQASVEVQPQVVESVKRGGAVQVNGQEFTGPLYITRKGTLKGFAFCSHGADDATSVAIAAKWKDRMMTDSSFQDFVSAMLPGTRIGDLTDSQLAGLHANYCGRSDANDDDRAAVLPLIAASSDPVVVEEKRLRQIEAATRGKWGDDSEKIMQLKAQTIGGDMTVDELLTELRAIRMERALQGIPQGHTAYASNRGRQSQVIEAAFCLAGGLSNPEKHYSEQVLDAADKMRSSVSLQQLILGAAIQNGYHAKPGEHITQGNILNVLRAAFVPDIRASGGWSAVDLSVTLSNVAEKYMRDGFDSVDQTALRISAVKPVRNFKETKTVSLIGDAKFRSLAPGGQLEHGEWGEEVYTNQAATYGILFGIDRTAIVNDDLDVITLVPKRIGRGGMLTLNNLVWSLFLDNGSFFTNDRGNLIDNALDLDGLAAAERVFVNQTDPAGDPLGISPAILLVPPSRKTMALQLMNSQLTITGSDVTLPNANVWRGRFSVESSPYMENSTFVGNSAEAWYLLASPQQLPVIEIAALNGNVQPTVQTADADFHELGVKVRGFSDVGVALQEYRGGVKSAGSET